MANQTTIGNDIIVKLLREWIMEVGDFATLIRPYKGYRNIELVERLQYTWLVRICESGLEIEVYEDEFVLD